MASGTAGICPEAWFVVHPFARMFGACAGFQMTGAKRGVDMDAAVLKVINQARRGTPLVRAWESAGKPCSLHPGPTLAIKWPA